MPSGNSRLIASLFAVYAVLLFTIVGAGIGGVTVVDAVRAYAMGESAYAKAQKSAVLALHRYAHSRDPAEFAAYERAIAVPVNDRRAREVLEDRSRPAAESHDFFVAGDNHPNDVATLAWFFRLFGDTALFRGPVETWRQADAKVAELEAAARTLRRTVRSNRSGEADEPAVAAQLVRIDALDAELAVLEAAFARQMAEVAHTVSRFVHAGIGGLGAALALIAAGFTAHTRRRICAAGAEVRQREARFRDVAELAADWIWETDADFRISYISERIEAVMQAPKQTFLGRRCWELGGDPGPGGWDSHIAAMKRHETFTGFEYSLTGAAGGPRRIRVSGKPVYAEDGTFLGYRGTGTDVTAESTALGEAEAKRELLETTFENLGHGVSVVDADLDVVAFNRRFLELLDFPPDRFAIGDPFAKFIRHNAERGEYGEGDIEEMVRARVAQARRSEPHRIERARPDGTILEICGEPLPSGGFVTTYRDVTARRSAEAARREAEGLLWTFLDGSPESISLKDTEGRYLLCNAAFERFTGVTRERIRGRTDREAFGEHPAMLDDVETHDRLVLETRAPVHQEREEFDSAGRVRTRSVTKFPIHDGEGRITGIGTFNQDITELKHAERQLRQALKMQAVGQLTGGVAHDFNNLLAVVLGNLELLHERLEGEPALAGLAERALGAALRGAALTRRLLAFARQQPLQPQAVDVAPLIDSMADLLRQSVGESVALELRVARDVRRCFVDPAELEAALLNLAVNARDAMPEGGRLTIAVANGSGPEGDESAHEAAAGADAEGPFVVFTVTDEGSGMTEEVLARAFEPFFTTKSPEKGSGLGLSVVYGFARQSGGHVTIDSAPGKGTTVRLCVPQAAGEGASAETGATSAATERGNGEHVLVAEDDDMVREHVTAQLESLGYRVTVARDGPEALAALKGGAAVDLLLTDIVMPGGMNGFELAETACRLRPALPVLFTSGYLDGGLPREEALATGARLLRKPYLRDELARRLRLALDGGACDEAPDSVGAGWSCGDPVL